MFAAGIVDTLKPDIGMVHGNLCETTMFRCTQKRQRWHLPNTGSYDILSNSTTDEPQRVVVEMSRYHTKKDVVVQRTNVLDRDVHARRDTGTIAGRVENQPTGRTG